ncbi:type VI secretion system protein TssL, long form [Nitrosomonas sp.]|uniref:type VI secretion system protein TssL, long form n=1 Tax=Nitrosomonas sp. TaxID=42353 RepID=UPI001E1AC42A|nr:type VI secretion system protein TssL, long form [Nitrosomonas sp.]MCB1949958.1 type VI secretion system protein TssL, long form [Nitrosomonas sp.]MDR4515599.1 type VI secretion system protein TssL, long form [Nitrosomonas sp.]
MSQDDPFSSSHSDRTITIPTPGGRTPLPQNNRNDQSELQNFESLSETDLSFSGLNPLVTAANALFNLIPHLRTSQQVTNLTELRDFLARQIQFFEKRARTAGIAPEKIIPARYALCTFLDETIASTPWGSGEWGKYSLLVMFQKEVFGGEKFFQLVSRLAENPGKNIELLEFLYVCLALGFEGRYRIMERGREQLEQLKERLIQIIRNERNEYEKDLSLHWRVGTHTRRKIFRIIPLWVYFSFCGTTLLFIYLGFNYSLNNISDPVFNRIQSIQAKMPIPKTAVVPVATSQPHLRELLANDISSNLLTVHEENGRNTIILTGDNIFKSGSTTVSEKYIPVLSRVASALDTIAGNIRITGHTDNRPIRTMRFPSNWHLSQERANSVMSLLINLGIDSKRLTAEGSADAYPVASNDTAEGRSRNRRVEIDLY